MAKGAPPHDAEHWQRVEALLDQALDLPPEERQAFVREACSTDPKLADEVLDLLTQAQQSGPLDGSISELAEAAMASDQDIGTGRRIGVWRLAEPLARGGMGRVFAAHREEGDFEQRAAVKLLRWEVATPELIERFRTERQILAGLDHPSIARLIDGGVTDSGIPYLVMELVEGQPIDAYCTEHELTLEQRLRLFLEVCEAVRAAHAQLVIHRDLKPSNILVTAQGQVRLIDFGVGKLLQPAAEGGPTLTLGQIAPATPAYAAPEQLEGKAMSIATDVYGLGAVLFELLTGQRLFDSDSQSPLDVARQVIETEPSPPSRAVKPQHPLTPKELRGDLDNIVLSALRKEPERRYASVEALGADLRRYLTGQPVSASPATAAYQAKKFIQRHRTAVALTFLLFAGAVAAGVAIARQARIAHQQATRAQATAEFLERALIDANLQSNSAGDDSLASLLERAEPRVDIELAELPEVRARVRLLLARAFQGIGRREDSRRLHRLALEEAIEAHGAESSEAGWALVGCANTDTAEGSPERLDLLHQALDIMDAQHGRRSRQAMEVLNLIGHAHTHAGQLEDGAEAYRQALDIALQVLGPESSWNATALANLGSVQRRLGRHDASIESLRRALTHFVSAAEEDTYTALGIRNNLALALVEAGQLEAAEIEYRRTIELKREKLGDDHPGQASTLTNFGRFLMDQGRFPEAAEPIRRAVGLLQASAPESDFTRIAAEINLATLSLELDEVEAAHGLYAAAHRKFTEQLGESHSATLRVGWLLGEAERRRGRTDAARSLLERVADDGQASGQRHDDRLLSLGRLAIDTGQPDLALEHLDSARARFEQHLEPGDLRLIETDAERVLAGTSSPEERRRQLRPLYLRLQEQLPADNWRLKRLDRFLPPPSTGSS